MSFRDVSNLKLETLSDNANIESIPKKISDKTIKELINNSHSVIFNIINDLIKMKSIQDIPEIFLQEDRIFYLGLYCLGIACFIKILKK